MCQVLFSERQIEGEKGGGGRERVREKEGMEEDGGEGRHKACLISKYLKFWEPALFISLF